MITVRDTRTDDRLRAVAEALREYEQQHPEAKIDVYRQNPVSIRVRIIDPDFAGVSKADRHDTVWSFVQALPEDQQADISMLLLLAPDELKTSFANAAFDQPTPSRL